MLLFVVAVVAFVGNWFFSGAASPKEEKAPKLVLLKSLFYCEFSVTKKKEGQSD